MLVRINDAFRKNSTHMVRIPLFILILIATLHLIAYAELSKDITAFMAKASTASILLAALMISTLVLVLAESILSLLKTEIDTRLFARDLDRRIRQLKPADKLVLSKFVEHNRMTLPLNPEDPAVAWLEALKLIIRGEKTDTPRAMNYRITLSAMDAFSKNPNLLR